LQNNRPKPKMAISPSAVATTPSPAVTKTVTTIKTIIENATDGLSSRCFNYLSNRVLPGSRGKENALTICDYMSALRSEINPSDNYRRDNIIMLCDLSIFLHMYNPWSDETSREGFSKVHIQDDGYLQMLEGDNGLQVHFVTIYYLRSLSLCVSLIILSSSFIIL
jgi:hypothetical protein